MSTMKFKVGDRVEVLDDALQGIVSKVTSSGYVIETTDGFDLEFHEKELILKGDASTIRNASKGSQIEKAKTEKINKSLHRVVTEKKSRKEEFVLEIDLHIEKLVKDPSRMTNFDMLNMQVDTARGQLEFAIKNRIPKIVFIHGSGEGVLKSELEYLLGRYSEVDFKDANYRKYGLGATEVYIKQNS